jgi:hypothetical protein
MDMIVVRDLATDYAVRLDDQIFAGSGAHGQVSGVRNTAGIHQLRGSRETLRAKVSLAIDLVQSERNSPPDVIAAHPDIAELLGNKFQDVSVAECPTMTIEDQDVVHVMRSSDLMAWESSVRTRVITMEDDGMHYLKNPEIQLYGYISFTAARYPEGIVEILLPKASL